LAKQNEQTMQQIPKLGEAFAIVENVVIMKHFQLLG
jgi:hypothetical protein